MRRVIALLATATVCVVGLVVGVIAMVGDGDEDQSGAAGRFGPGTEIGDGFTVADGSTLLGSRFPRVTSIYAGMPRSGWSAVLLVDGDPGEVLKAYARQSDTQGIPLQQLGRDTCFRARSGLIDCELSGEAGPLDASAGRSFSVRLLRSEAGKRTPFASHLFLSYQDWGDTTGLLPETATASADAVDVATEFEPPGRRPELPTTGEPLVDKRYAPDLDPAVVTVEEGSELLAPPVPYVCATGGYRGVFRVTGNPRDVVERYAVQFTETFGQGDPGFDGKVREAERDGLKVVEAFWGQSGGGGLEAIAVTVREGEVYLAVERCND